MNNISIYNETNSKVDKRLIKQMVRKVLKAENRTSVELSVIIVNNDHIKALNKDYCANNSPTDVLTFVLPDETNHDYKYQILGDIYISIDKVKEQALEYGHTETRELAFLVVHGMYHLLGFDHKTKKDAGIMREREEVILNERNDTKR